ncbi:MAG TPA: magnesium transporter, partial [Hyphomicrobium sp.]|nr:magnesium transporter [Hyphomicrobium sp.]
MLRSYRRENSHIVLQQEGLPVEETAGVQAQPVWIDLYNPAPQDNRFVEQLLSIALPTREEMQEIEVSARLYQEDGAEFMTLTAASQLET